MRKAAIIISIIIAILIAVTISGVLGILIAFCCVVYQAILEYGRTKKSSGPAAIRVALVGDIVRNGVFLIPLVLALINGMWLVALATVVVYGINIFMS
jgi:hypothetical protein